MHRIVLLLLPIWFPTLLIGQDLSGKWKGVFAPNQDQEGKVYNYEVEIKELPNHSLSVLTYTRFSNNFSAKASATGMHSPNTELVSIVESKFEDMRLSGNFQACLMSSYLTYNTIRGRETLEGTYISSNSKMGKDCGSGTIYLEKEIPLAKLFALKSKTQSPTTTPVKNKLIATKLTETKSVVTKTNLAQIPKTSNPNNKIASSNNNIALNQNSKLIINPSKSSNTATVNALIDLPKSSSNSSKEESNSNSITANTEIAKSSNRGQILPYVLVGRENKLVNKIDVSSSHISFDMYDNGTIDNDSIMVFDNKVQILNNQRLSYKAIHFELDFSKETQEHEIIIVAQNLGSVPPNTALMVLKDGTKRKEFYITSTLQTNAMLIINYKAPN
ncbi:MAG: hypothetical protein NT104_02940 [Bacteroidetes bacterium]|nr:hypothetical protein [Bacteroidota bacterium]